MITVPPASSSAQVRFQGRGITGQTLTAATTWYPVALGGEDYDSHNAHSTSTNPSRFVAPRTDDYLCVGVVHFAGGTTGGARKLGLWKNGTLVPGGVADLTHTTASMALTVAIPGVLVPLNAGEYVELQVQSAAAGAQLFGTTTDYGSLFRVETR